MNTSLVERATKQSLTEEGFPAELNMQDRRLKEQFTQKEKGGKVSFQIHFGSSGLQETLSLLDELYGAVVVWFFQSPAASDVQENDATPFYNCSISMQVK